MSGKPQTKTGLSTAQRGSISICTHDVISPTQEVSFSCCHSLRNLEPHTFDFKSCF